MECPWYKGTKGMPFSEMLCHHMKCPEMPFKYNGTKGIPFSEMHCYHMKYFTL
jgi:hypothetical protein